MSIFQILDITGLITNPLLRIYETQYNKKVYFKMPLRAFVIFWEILKKGLNKLDPVILSLNLNWGEWIKWSQPIDGLYRHHTETSKANQ